MNSTRSKEKRSPLKRKPLRNPGESIQQERQRLVEDEWIPYIFLAILMAFVAFVEWVRWYSKTPPQPIVMSVVALIAVGYASYKFVTIRRRMKALRLGLEGVRRD